MSEAAAGFVYRATFRFRAPPWTVFEALTQPETLSQWFAEHVELQPRVGGAYRFWGKHTYGVPAPLDADQTIARFDPPKEFAFDWTWLDAAGQVRFELSETDAGTELQLSHAFERVPERVPARDPEEAKGIIDAFWSLAMGNLRQHLRSGAPATLPDFTAVDDSVEVSIVIQAAPSVVYEALLDPASLDKWMSAAARVEPRVGGTYSYGWDDQQGGPARILALDPGRLLVTDWTWRGEPPTQVRWELEACEEGTRVTLIHSGFGDHPAAHNYAQGWCAYLVALKRVAERSRRS